MNAEIVRAMDFMHVAKRSWKAGTVRKPKVVRVLIRRTKAKKEA
jgi:hypothetical protein